MSQILQFLKDLEIILAYSIFESTAHFSKQKGLF
jgi:hypothetical protein